MIAALAKAGGAEVDEAVLLSGQDEKWKLPGLQDEGQGAPRGSQGKSAVWSVGWGLSIG